MNSYFESGSEPNLMNPCKPRYKVPPRLKSPNKGQRKIPGASSAKSMTVNKRTENYNNNICMQNIDTDVNTHTTTILTSGKSSGFAPKYTDINMRSAGHDDTQHMRVRLEHAGSGTAVGNKQLAIKGPQSIGHEETWFDGGTMMTL